MARLSAQRAIGKRFLLAFLLAAWTASGGATVYLTQEQALALAFQHPARARRCPLIFNRATRAAAEKIADARIAQRGVLAFTGELREGGDGAVLLDAVLGKHEAIDYMVVLDRRATVRFVEILAYRESYGGEVRGAAWRRQFHGLSPRDLPAPERNVMNLSGATLSCRHVTEGVRKLLAVAAVYATELGLETAP